ncbi:MAG: ATP-dependent DNA helicase RecG [Lachnospiraceae bacterium]|nr:ATP-dependent DNA helicase RecG [Lachnospiraceae bacterium]
MKLTDPVKAVKGIGDKTTKTLEKLGIYTVRDLLCHYPRGYEVYELPVPIRELKEGQIVAIEASVATFVEVHRRKGLQIVSCNVQDPTGTIRLTWFNQVYLKNVLKRGVHYIFRGKVVRKNAVLVIDQPKIYKKDEYRVLLNVMQPVYPLTDGLTNRTLQKAVDQALVLTEFPEDYLPKRVVKEQCLIPWLAALREIHFPKARDTMLEARKRLVFDEFFQFVLQLRYLKEHRSKERNSFVIRETAHCSELIDELPYTLTAGQQKVIEEIRADMTGETVMNRLIQGDVGSGKTILAVYALLLAAENGYQGCMMVPTEVLARQHYEAMLELLTPFGIRVCLLTGSMTQAAKRAAYEQIAAHEADIIVGTHALIQEKVVYDKLALVVTDEQHRFGVHQRENLSKKGEHPHILVMSATPIPRTLAIVLYGDLDVSLLTELPADRLPIKNCVVGTTWRPNAYRFIEKQVAEGRQAYVICPMVEESEEIEAENVAEYTQKLEESLPANCRIGMLHGKMRPAQKNEIMEQFASGELQVLVSTTVVEVGVNVPNATVMMIENAERFGLAQLHQLRGRVGRGKHQSYCIFVNGSERPEAKERLEIMNRSNDGFLIAQEDLKLRGPGDVFGIRQSGELEFTLADIYQDADVLTAANAAVSKLSQEEYLKICAELPQNGEKAFY